MGTKWKSRKSKISFMVFVLGVSLTLGGVAGIFKNKPGSVNVWQVDKLLGRDYQQSYRFQDYITGRFWDFLTMAVGGSLADAESWWYEDGYYGRGDYGTGVLITDREFYQDNLDEMLDGYEELEETLEGLIREGASEEAETVREEMKVYQEEIENYRREMEIDQGYEPEEPTEEERKKIAQEFHDRIKEDKNLLYTISYEDQILYTNSGLLAADGKMTAPEGYNFLLYFDGEKVRIMKDGKELDIYGDGYYREDDGFWQGTDERRDWYVPGYVNFPVDETMKKARVFLAAAKEPVMYRKSDLSGSVKYESDNTLYWLNVNDQANRKLLERDAVCFILGLVLLILSLLCGKSRKDAAAKIADTQERIWVECKVLLLFGLLFLVFFIIKSSNQGYGWWQELMEAYYYECGSVSLLLYGREILQNANPLAWIVLFWLIWLIWNDLKHNRKIWKQSLIRKLYQTFSAKSPYWPLAKKMALRNGALFGGVALYVLLILMMTRWWINEYTGSLAYFILVSLCTICFFLLAYLVSRKNVETARDMEVISGCVSEIRNGNYRDFEGDYVGHDLQNIMTQLEDIRHGMEKAVEEQMKSQKMKVELIANVSHDIKTPLTSIISYVQFLKQEEGLPEHVKDYVKILDEKSQRLKNMVQDVFAVSKAASGELPMHMEVLDFGKLLRQTLADMEEQIEKSAVSFRTELPQTPVMIMADGERMYRVFQNLFQNAIQYSLAGSRVYVTLQTDGITAVASVKNASQMELDKQKDFAERFTRGDQSRTDGGSGLGLSIAQSFTEACKGEFCWETDADLFVVKVSFKIAE